jgi:hypothetical protein
VTTRTSAAFRRTLFGAWGNARAVRWTLAQLPVVVLAVAVLGYPFLWPDAPREATDTRGYQLVAQDYLTGHFERLHYRMPGFPLLLLATGAAYELTPWLFFTQLLLYALAVLLLLRWLQRAGVQARTVLAAAIVLVSPPFIEHTAYALSETLTCALLVAALWLTATGRDTVGPALLAGGVFGLTALVRPTYQLAPLAVVPVLLLHHQPRKALSLLCAAALVTGTFVLFNYSTTGYLGTMPALGFNLSTRTARVVERLPPGPLRDALIKARDAQLINGRSHTGAMYIWSVRPELPALTNLPDPTLERYMLRLNLELIAAAPLEYLTDVGRAAVTYWFPAATEMSFGQSRRTQLLWTVWSFAVVVAFWLPLLAIGGALVLHGLRSEEARRLLPIYELAVVLILYSMAVSCMLEVGNPRYRVPTDAIIVFAAAVSLGIWASERAATDQTAVAPLPPHPDVITEDLR